MLPLNLVVKQCENGSTRPAKFHAFGTKVPHLTCYHAQIFQYIFYIEVPAFFFQLFTIRFFKIAVVVAQIHTFFFLELGS